MTCPASTLIYGDDGLVVVRCEKRGGHQRLGHEDGCRVAEEEGPGCTCDRPGAEFHSASLRVQAGGTYPHITVRLWR